MLCLEHRWTKWKASPFPSLRNGPMQRPHHHWQSPTHVPLQLAITCELDQEILKLLCFRQTHLQPEGRSTPHLLRLRTITSVLEGPTLIQATSHLVSNCSSARWRSWLEEANRTSSSRKSRDATMRYPNQTPSFPPLWLLTSLVSNSWPLVAATTGTDGLLIITLVPNLPLYMWKTLGGAGWRSTGQGLHPLNLFGFMRSVRQSFLPSDPTWNELVFTADLRIDFQFQLKLLQWSVELFTWFTISPEINPIKKSRTQATPTSHLSEADNIAFLSGHVSWCNLSLPFAFSYTEIEL